MRFEYGLITSMGILVAGILLLIIGQPAQPPHSTYLDQINQQATLAKAENNQKRFISLMSEMQERLQTVASYELGLDVTDALLEENYNFPFRSPSEVQLAPDQPESLPICDIAPKITPQLNKIRSTELFSMFSEKYGNYPIKLIIQDERGNNSTIHYSLIAKSGNRTAQMWFHVDSCTDEISTMYNLRCFDKENEDSVGSVYKNEVISSFNNDSFCEIEVEPWRQKLYEYSESVSDEFRTLLENDYLKNDPTSEQIQEFQSEFQRMDLLGDMINHALDGNFEDKKMEVMMKQYREKFGSIPEEFLELIER